MTSFRLFSVFLLGLLLNENVNAIELCGAKDIDHCRLVDVNCMTDYMEPKLRKWMLKGVPEYFLDPVDPMNFKDLHVSTKKGVYKLIDVKVVGFSEAKLDGFTFDIAKGSLQYIYSFKFDVTAQKFVDADGNSLLESEPLIVHIDNLQVNTSADLKIINRCDGKQYIKNSNTDAIVSEPKEGDVVFKSGLLKPSPEILEAFPRVIGKAASRKIAHNYRTLAKIVPVTALIKL